MQNSYVDHPAEEALERFLLQHCSPEELETIETHILACEPCVSRLEILETDIAAAKLALQSFRPELATAHAKQRASWRSWFTVPNLSWAGAAAALALGLLVTPQLLRHPAPTAEVTLSAYRGNENTTVPQGRPLHVALRADGLPEGPVAVEVADDNGNAVWKGSSVVRQGVTQVNTPAMSEAGAHYLRLYSAAPSDTRGDLLREFVFQVR